MIDLKETFLVILLLKFQKKNYFSLTNWPVGSIYSHLAQYFKSGLFNVSNRPKLMEYNFRNKHCSRGFQI